MHGLENLLTKEELKQYRDSEHREGVKILYDTLKKKLETEPDYEIWVPFTYYHHYWRSDLNEEYIQSEYILISNKGGLQRPKRTSFENKGTGNYSFRQISLPEGTVKFVLHRAVASTFVPVPDELKEWDYLYLQTNHIDGDKSNADFQNLEWVTHSGNIQHAATTNLRKYIRGEDHYAVKPLLGKVIIPGEYHGFTFIVNGLNEIISVVGKENAAHPHACARGKRKESKGCEWSYATADDIMEYGGVVIPMELLSLIKNYQGIKQGIFIGRRIKDNHVVIFKTYSDAEAKGFSCKSINKCVNGKLKTYQGFTFIRTNDETLILKAEQETVTQITVL